MGEGVAGPPRQDAGGASTRPGPEAGMGASSNKTTCCVPSMLQRGPARRPGWAAQDEGRPFTGHWLQRGPTRRPGWAP